MNKIKLILCMCGVALMSGCATPAQTALAGAIGGAVIATELNHPRPIYVAPPPRPRPITCHTQFIGHNAYGRAIYRQVCH